MKLSKTVFCWPCAPVLQSLWAHFLRPHCPLCTNKATFIFTTQLSLASASLLIWDLTPSNSGKPPASALSIWTSLCMFANGMRTGETSLRRCVWRHMLWPLEYMTFYFTKLTNHCPSIKHLVLYHRWFEKLCPREGSWASKSGPSVHSLICSLLPAGSPRVAFSWNQCFQLLLEHSYPASSCKK